MNQTSTTSEKLSPVRAPRRRWFSLIWMLLILPMAFGPIAVMAQRPLGIDVSDYQGSINWTSVKNAGISFAWTKATEGTGAGQGYFTANEANAVAAGVPIGAYHYARYDLNSGTPGATDKANYFWSVAGPYIKAT